MFFVSASATENGSPWGTTIVLGDGLEHREGVAGRVFPGQRETAARRWPRRPGRGAKRTSAVTSGTATSQIQSRWRGWERRRENRAGGRRAATSRIAASHRAGERACSKSLRTSSMIPSNWSPTRGCLRASSRASCSSRRCRQTQRCRAHGILAQATAAATNRPTRSQPGVSQTRSRQNSSRYATRMPKAAAATASTILIVHTRRRYSCNWAWSDSGNRSRSGV